MNNVQAPAVQREVFQAGLKSTNGLMLFDASQVNWPSRLPLSKIRSG